MLNTGGTANCTNAIEVLRDSVSILLDKEDVYNNLNKFFYVIPEDCLTYTPKHVVINCKMSIKSMNVATT